MVKCYAYSFAGFRLALFLVILASYNAGGNWSKINREKVDFPWLLVLFKCYGILWLRFFKQNDAGYRYAHKKQV